MSSSCVPPKPCVVHEPDPHSHDRDDTSSECGSLCTCSTSSSMTSLSTSIVSRDPRDSTTATGRPSRHRGSSSASASVSTAPLQPQAQQHGTDNSSENPFIVVFVPPRMLQAREGTTSCDNCQTRGTALQEALRVYLLTGLEFCPWVAGFVMIYYAFSWWGLGAGFSAFLFMMGTHALLRFLKTRGSLVCSSARLSQMNQTTGNQTEETQEEGQEDEGERENEPPDASEDVINENPPSYEIAMVKPPPYDLHHHLTPTQPRSQPPSMPAYIGDAESKKFLSVAQVTLSGKLPRSSVDDDEDDDVFLPSYQDAIRLALKSEKSEKEEMEQQA